MSNVLLKLLSRETCVGLCSLLCRLTGSGEEPIMGNQRCYSRGRREDEVAILEPWDFWNTCETLDADRHRPSVAVEALEYDIR